MKRFFLAATIFLITVSSVKPQETRVTDSNHQTRVTDWNLVQESLRGVSSIRRKGGIVPDAGTAIKVAEAILIPIYGEDQIAKERPFVARLYGGTWIVTGTLPPNFLGGTAVVKLKKLDGRVVFINHFM